MLSTFAPGRLYGYSADTPPFHIRIDSHALEQWPVIHLFTGYVTWVFPAGGFFL